MDINLVDKDDLSILELSGRMDATTTGVFDEACRAQLARGRKKVVIDMGNLVYISSAGLRGILGMVKAMKSSGGKLAFCSLQPMVVEVFRISGFSSMLSVHNTCDEAVRAIA